MIKGIYYMILNDNIQRQEPLTFTEPVVMHTFSSPF
jgi:hypothetical protein